MATTKQIPSKKKYDKRYKRERMLSVAFRLNRSTDSDLIDIYMSIPNKMAWFREALRAYGRAS